MRRFGASLAVLLLVAFILAGNHCREPLRGAWSPALNRHKCTIGAVISVLSNDTLTEIVFQREKAEEYKPSPEPLQHCRQ